MSQLEERKVISPPPFAASPTLSHPFPSEYPPEVRTVHRSDITEVPHLIMTDYSDCYLICRWLCFCLQYGDESSKNILKCREPDYAGQYSPWSCETIGSYIGSKDAKPKDVMVSGAMEMMVMNWWIFQHRSVEISFKCVFCFAFFIRMWRLKS